MCSSRIASSSVPSIPSGEGERRAVTGLHPQYQIAAELTLALIREFEWVKVADPAAGAADDFQLATRSGQLHALQVKWSAYPGLLTFQSLIGSARPLIGDLAQGWQRLREAYPVRALSIHLVTNDLPSPNDAVRPAVMGEPDHFAAFLSRSFYPVQAKLRRGERAADLRLGAELAEWQEAWHKLGMASGLEEEQFWAFAADLYLNLGVADDPFPELSRTPKADRRDRDDLASLYLATVADPAHVVTISAAHLLERLGWADRLAFRNRHSFPVSKAYRPNETAVGALLGAIQHSAGGYLAVLGPAGAGKSSLLAATALPADRVIHYYAYVPDAPDPSTGRGESDNFFYDVVTALDNAGLHTSGTVDPRDRLGNKDRFLRQMDDAHREWEQHGRRTIIVVDGLDHIPREQHPARSLIDDLPSPSQVPAGVLIILGSQLMDIFPAAVQAALDGRGRTVEVPPLPAATVLAIAADAGPGRWLSTVQKQRLIRVSEGHPLSLTYLLEELSSRAVDPAAVRGKRADEILDEGAAYGGRIYERYLGYWQRAAPVQDLHRLLGITARLRPDIHLEWLRTWNSPELVARFAETFAPFFVKDGACWTFIHNSFRVFLIDRTATVAGEYDPDQDRRLHADAAQVCELSGEQWTIYRDEEISQRFAAGQHEQVLALASASKLRSRLTRLTPVATIRQDINLALRSAGMLGDPIAVLGLAVMKLELEIRTHALRPDELALALIDIGEYATAMRQVLQGRSLRIGTSGALDAASRLMDAEQETDAGMIIEAIGSLNILLETAEPGDAQSVAGLVYKWVTVHARIRPASEILKEIDAAFPAGSVADRGPAPRGRSTEDLRMNALIALAAATAPSADARGRSAALAALADVDAGAAAALELRVPAEQSHGGALERIDAALARLGIRPASDNTARWTPQSLALVPATLRIEAAELLTRVSGITPEAQALVDSCRIPQTAGFGRDGQRPLWLAYRLHRLRYLLSPGSGRAFAGAEPATDDGLAGLHLALTDLAELDASVLRSRLDPARRPGPAMAVARQLHRLYEIPARQRRSWTNWYIAVGAAEAFFRQLISVVASADPEATLPLWDLFTEAWTNPSRAEYWPYSVRIAVLEALAQAGADRAAIVRELRDITSAITTSDGLAVSDRIADLLRAATALGRFGATQGAAETITAAVQASLAPGVRDEDDQLAVWVKHLGQHAATGTVPKLTLRATLTEVAVHLDQARAAGANARDAATQLIEISFASDPGLAVDMADWFTERGVLDSAESLAGLLEGAAADPAVPPELTADAARSLYMPVSVSPLPEMASKLEGRGSEAAQRILADGVRRWVLPSMRGRWNLTPNADAAAPLPLYIGGPPGPDRDDRTPSVAHEIALSDGAGLSPEQAADMVSTVPEFLALLRRIVTQAGYGRSAHIGRAVGKISAQIHPDDIAQLMEEFARIGATADSYALIAARLTRLGDHVRAQEVVSEALRHSELSGWGRYWDGGTRSRFWAELTATDPIRFTSQAVDDLATALISGTIYLNPFIREFSGILPIIGVSPSEAWQVISGFMGALCHPIGDGSTWAPPERNESGIKALLRHVSTLADHPVRTIDWGVRNILRRALTDPRSTSEAARVIADRSTVSRAAAEAVLGAVSAARRVPSNAASILQDAVAACAATPDQIVRDVAGMAAEALDLPHEPPRRRPLSLSYSLAAPPVPPHAGPVFDDEGIAVLDPTSPRASLGTYDMLLEDWVSELSGIDDAVLIRQADRLGRELTNHDPWTRGGVKAHAQRLRQQGWLHHYRHWALMTGRRGTAAVLADLVDARLIPDPAPSTISASLFLIDPVLDLAEPEAIPASVPRPARRYRFGGEPGTWTGDTAEAARLYAETEAEDEVVIGEWSDWTELSWTQATERRVRLVHQPSPAAIGRTIGTYPPPYALHSLEKEMNLGRFYTATAYGAYAAAASRPVRPRRLPLVAGGQSRWAEARTDQWLALNPDLGNHLGWVLSDSGLFEWHDHTGQQMARSRWWIQCLDSHQPPHFNDDAGEGWQVLVTPSGWRQLSEAIGSLELSTVVARAASRKAQWDEVAFNTSKIS